MPLYSHIGPDGVIQEFRYKMGEAPAIGDTVFHGGVAYKRISDYATVAAATVGDRHFTSKSLCRYDRYHAANGGKFDKSGMPQFTGKKMVDEYCARSSGEDASGGTVYE